MRSLKQNRHLKETDLVEKARRYCAYAERCSFDVRQHLTRMGADDATTEAVIRMLCADKYLDNQRFATLFALGKLNNNKWGKVKIRAELLKREIAQHIIDKAVTAIDEDAYLLCLQQHVQRKTKELERNQTSNIKEKVATYCMQKGFEKELVFAAVRG